MRATRTCTISQHSSNIHAAVKRNRWPGDRGTRGVVPEAQHTQTMELSPGKSEYPARVLRASSKDLVMVDELAAEKLIAIDTGAAPC